MTNPDAPIPRAFLDDPEALLWAQAMMGNRFPAPVNATYTAKSTDRFILVDSTAGAVTVNLPDATLAQVKGLLLYIKRVAGGNNVTIDPFSTQTIDGASTVVLSATGHWRVIYSDGANWQVWAQNQTGNFGSENVTTTGTVEGGDLHATDDLDVDDDANIDGDLVVAGTFTLGGVPFVNRTARQAATIIAAGNPVNDFALNDDTLFLQFAGNFAGATAITLNGITGGAQGRVLYVWAIDGANLTQITVANEAGASTAANRIRCPTGGLTIPLRTGRAFEYNTTDNRWSAI